MPGLGIADLLRKVFTYRKNGESDKDFTLLGKIIPQIFFALHNLELVD